MFDKDPQEQQSVHDSSSSPHVRDQGLDSRHDQLLRAVRVDQAVAAEEVSGEHGLQGGESAVVRGSSAAGRSVRVHPLRLLLHLLSLLLVARRQVPRTLHPAAGLPMDRRLARRDDRGAFEESG